MDNRGFNLPVIPAGETDENGVPLGNDFTSDINVRRAINLAIDRDEMIEHVLNGYGTAAYSVCDQMPWYNAAAEVEYDPGMAAAILKEAGWSAGSDGILEKDGVRAEFTMLYPTGDSVRQALAEDTANQLKEIGIKVTTEGVGWDTAYDRAQSTPLMWGWGAHTPMELYNIYHTAPGKEYAEYSPYANEKVDEYMDEALAESDLEKSYELWKNAQWDGTSGITQDGDLPWIWLVNIDHLYWVKDGLQVAEQKLHPWTWLSIVKQCRPVDMEIKKTGLWFGRQAARMCLMVPSGEHSGVWAPGGLTHRSASDKCRSDGAGLHEPGADRKAEKLLGNRIFSGGAVSELAERLSPRKYGNIPFISPSGGRRVIGEKVMNSIWLFYSRHGCFLVALAFSLGVLAGKSAVGSWTDRDGYSLFVASTPAFWVAMVLLMVFAQKLHRFPIGFSVPIGMDAGQISIADRIRHPDSPALSITGISSIALHTRKSSSRSRRATMCCSRRASESD